LLAFAISNVGADWTFGKAVLLVLAVIGGGLIEGAVQVTLGSFSFRVLNALALRTTVNEVFNLYGNYPTHIFPRLLEYLLTFVLPVAFVAYFPASAILGRGDQLTLPEAFAWISPVLGICLFALAVRFWGWQSRNYQSAGN
jgi:ABC-2 type transport system permease protein